ncbi:hypothetical protein [Terricaulis silvestris]|uniref:Uncharacterized protein n=1 Tax=Terricaulis silvestris TaxID=2686094 RepID=A0A6I6MTB3_9CAUL|nr:hypothetical protein [Terricaulis silvestris]QGZ94942.1 hypothetical protein DSM104635_01777 [Terricaulis silvestris]
MRSFAATVAALERANIPVEAACDQGCMALTTHGARLIGLSLSERDENLLYTHPRLEETEVVIHRPEVLAAGIGGDRLWFAPELRYHWRGAPDWVSFSNNSVPKESDPGAYVFVDAGANALSVAGAVSLPTTTDAPPLPIRVGRTISFAPPPLPHGHALMRPVDYVGVRSDWRLDIEEGAKVGRVDLWHILQAEVDARAIAPVNPGRGKDLLLYSPNHSDWTVRDDHVHWRFRGAANAKLGLSAKATTGRAGFVRRLSDGRTSLIVRDFPVRHDREYGDHPHGAPRNDQVLQLWDGFGFGEVEYHSPVLDAAEGARSLEESDHIWAFASSATAIAALGSALLAVDIHSYVTKEMRA